MSVCSQMGNSHGKAEKKKKKELVKDDPQREQSELENGDLQQQGSELFQRDFLKRRDRTRDLVRQCGTTSHESDISKLNVECQGYGGNGDLQQKGSELFQEEQSRRRDVAKDFPKQRGTTSHESDSGELNVDCQGDAENVDDVNLVSPNEAIQSNVRCTLWNGEDPIGGFDDSSLVSDHVTGNKSSKVCGGLVTDEHDKATTDPELVKSGMSTGDATGNAVGNVSGEVHADVPTDRNAPVDIPAYGSDAIPGNVLVDVTGNVTGNVADNVETPGNISGVCAQSEEVPKHVLYPNQTVPAMVSTPKKKPTTGDDISSEPVETSSEQSIPPTPPSKKESGTPTPMQIVSGVNHAKSSKDDAENLKVTDQLISEVVTDNSLFLEKLSKYLDRESRVIKCWKHLAYVMDVPAEERNQFDVYTEHSPTEDLFNYLSDFWNQDLKVIELKGKLKLIHRNDVIADIEKGGFKDAMKVSDLISGEPKFIKLLSPKLDMESRTIGNWRSLAAEFGIRKQKTEQFGLRGSGPTGALFSYMRTAQGLHDLTMDQLRSYFHDMERKDLVNLLEKHSIEGSCLVKKVLVDGSELLAEIGERLNKEIRAVKNWRNLAYRLNIPPETYGAFDTSKEKAKSPTKMMFQWLAKWKPDLNIGDLLKGIKVIDRFDVVEIVTKEAEAALEKFKKDIEEASKQHCAFVDGSTEQPTANQALHDLQQMHQDADQRHVKKVDFLSNLETNAFNKGFRVFDNRGEGDCMFLALSEQLNFAKGIQRSAAELRQELVQYLHQNPKLPDGTDFVNFIHGYPSWTSYLEKMAKAGTWGDNVMLLAAANYFNTPIRVISSLPGHEDIIINPQSQVCRGADTLVLGHVHEEHYVSLLPLTEGSDEGVARGNQYGQQLEGYQLKQVCQQQQRQGVYQSQGSQQMPLYQQQPREQELQQRRGFRQPQDDQQRQGYPHHPSVQQLPQLQPPLSRDLRIRMKVLDLPKKVYSKICVKLNIKRDISFDDFRMLAEALGMDRDESAYSGQQINPTDFIFSEYHSNVTVGELDTILRKIERLDVAAVLEDWIQHGST